MSRPCGVTPSPVAALGHLVGRIREAAEKAERAYLQRELVRIADELVAVRKAIMDSDRTARTPDYERNDQARRKNPTPGMRRCSVCHSVLPVEMFVVTDRDTGKRRSECKPCYNERQRTRYVRAGYKIVTVEVLDGDPCIGHPCPNCGEPFEAGQHVQGDNVHHADCRLARLESGGGPTPALCKGCGGPFMAEDEGHQFCSESCVIENVS